jgi:intein-encoded DNA endonuclease-like protein
MTLSFAASPTLKPERPRRMSKNVCVKYLSGQTDYLSIAKRVLVNHTEIVNDRDIACRLGPSAKIKAFEQCPKQQCFTI